MSALVMKLKQNDHTNIIELSKKIIAIIFANFLISIAFNAFFIPNNLLSGGVGGLSLMFHYLTEMPTFLFYVILNIPLFIIGFIFIDGEFIFNSLISLVSMTMFLNLTSGIGQLITINDLLIETIIGAVLSGTGMGLLFKMKSSQGGFDIIAVILKKKYNVEIKNLLLLSNFIVISISGFIFDFRLASYTLLGLFIAYEILAKVKSGVNPEKNAMIITDQPEAVTKTITSTLGRGTTFVNAQGGYTNDSKTIVYCTLKNSEIVELKNIINQVDQNSFLTINDLNEVKGQGFKSNFI